MQCAPGDRRLFPDSLSQVRPYILSNPKYIHEGKALLRAIAHDMFRTLKESVSLSSASGVKQAPAQNLSQDPSSGLPSPASENESDSSRRTAIQKILGVCVQLAKYIHLCSESCFEVLRDNYLAGVFPKDFQKEL